MQFNSFLFIFVFLPVFLLAYFACGKLNDKLSHVVLILAGAVFYSFAGAYSCVVLLISVFGNFTIATLISRYRKMAKTLLRLAIAGNVGLLIYYKYAAYYATIVSDNEKTYSNSAIIIPLGVSFFFIPADNVCC